MIPTDTRIAPDSRPGKIIGVGLNYAAHAAQLRRPAPRRPQIFLKAPSAVIGNGQAIVLPAESARVEHEAELAVVIGQTMRRVTARGALEGIAGYCCANDVTARDVQHFDAIAHA
ncbi:fumarylacetoacetate hydrolase family protein [Streptomyces sp. NBC_01431]|uniref:fumarylacetoacetate hydrolase family protein n=1 Tax=Streptomyces sp. NBC_01431 TaxID=2903863 RepID=UPI002E3168C5|nr:fumarylacetoacetate hydrolase family protein [Streptomyces sp. NBC_01431]